MITDLDAPRAETYRRWTCVVALVLGIVLAVLGGCASSGPLYQPLDRPDTKISASEVTVELVDERLGLSRQPSDPPTFTMPGQDSEDVPAIPTDFIRDLETHLATLLDDTGGPIRFEIHLIKGTRGWGASLLSESERAEVELEVDVFATDSGRLLVHGSGKSWAKNTKLDASSESLDRLFRNVFLDALNRFIYDAETLHALDQQLRGGH